MGKVSEKLQVMYDWDDRLVTKIKEACKAKNERINEMGLFQSFFNTMGSTLVTRSHSSDPTEVTKVAKDRIYSHDHYDQEFFSFYILSSKIIPVNIPCYSILADIIGSF